MSPQIPDWCRLRRGRSNVVLIAPHGGRRPPADPAAPRERKVNDLHTADLTDELAEALDATAIVNFGRDRNEVDLNRIGQVRTRAPWFLDLILYQLRVILARYRDAQVLIVHGWNTGQPKCDLGVGGREAGGELRALGDAALSVSPEYWRTRVADFRRAGAAAHFATPVGERYPAAHQSNLLQAMTSRFLASADARLRQLAEWARDGRLNAVQLELGIPLRWPGPLRGALCAAAAVAFGEGAAADGPLPDPPPFARRTGEGTRVRGEPGSLLPSSGNGGGTGRGPRAEPVDCAQDMVVEAREPLGFHFHDPRAGIAAFTSIAPMGATTGGRLLLFLGGQEIALFTGEEPGRPAAVGSLAYAAHDDGFHLRFDGYAARLADAGLYLDLEAALAASALGRVQLDVRFTALGALGGHDPCPGRFDGALRVDEREVAIAARGFLDPLVALRGPGAHRARTHLAAAFDDRTAISLRAADEGRTTRGIVVTEARTHVPPPADLQVSCDGDAYTPSAFHLRFTQRFAAIRVQPLACMPILRPLGDGAYARITFGPARFEWDGQVGWGVYEYARRVED